MFVIECDRGGENGWLMCVGDGNLFVFTSKLEEAYRIGDEYEARALLRLHGIDWLNGLFVTGLSDLTVVELAATTD